MVDPGGVSVISQFFGLLVVALIVLVFVGVTCGLVITFVRQVIYTMNGVFWILGHVWYAFKYIICCGRLSRKRSTLTCLKRTGPGEETRCTGTRVNDYNSAYMWVSRPYCEMHAHVMYSRLFENHAAFERGKYAWHLYYAKSQHVSTKRRVKKAVKEAIERSLSKKKGFIYVFRSSIDLEYVTPVSEDAPYFYKIGMTTKDSAAERVREWDDAVFENQEGVGWWRVDDALSAEQLIHAMLVCSRFSRFNKDTDSFEIEWFYSTYPQIREKITRVVEATNSGDYSSLIAT